MTKSWIHWHDEHAPHVTEKSLTRVVGCMKLVLCVIGGPLIFVAFLTSIILCELWYYFKIYHYFYDRFDECNSMEQSLDFYSGSLLILYQIRTIAVYHQSVIEYPAIANIKRFDNCVYILFNGLICFFTTTAWVSTVFDDRLLQSIQYEVFDFNTIGWEMVFGTYSKSTFYKLTQLINFLSNINNCKKFDSVASINANKNITHTNFKIEYQERYKTYFKSLTKYIINVILTFPNHSYCQLSPYTCQFPLLLSSQVTHKQENDHRSPTKREEAIKAHQNLAKYINFRRQMLWMQCLFGLLACAIRLHFIYQMFVETSLNYKCLQSVCSTITNTASAAESSGSWCYYIGLNAYDSVCTIELEEYRGYYSYLFAPLLLFCFIEIPVTLWLLKNNYDDYNRLELLYHNVDSALLAQLSIFPYKKCFRFALLHTKLDNKKCVEWLATQVIISDIDYFTDELINYNRIHIDKRLPNDICQIIVDFLKESVTQTQVEKLFTT